MTQESGGKDSGLLNAVRWRCIGPPRGGRTVAVAGDPVNPAVFYFGACAGGVWKTDDAGTYWQNISDGQINTAAVGAIAVSDSDPNVIYVGMGEACIRSNVTYGDGVYKSTDAGKTWTHLGLSDTRHISRVRIHPKNPDIVYVAALGHAFGPNKERGIFRSTDGGKNWEQVLFKSENAGAADLSMDPINPRMLYAAIWQVRRNPWSLASGGPDSGIYRSTDGGDTWTEITRNPGLPEGLIGRVGLAASPAKSGRVWATVEAEDCGLFRSDDGGDTWEVASDSRDIQGRPWYYQHVFADTQDPDTLWVLNYSCWKSIDAGKTFATVGTPHGDNHDLWIDPRNPRRMIEGNDGGATVTFNGGDSWSTIYNQMTSQFYHIDADNQFPYHVYGTQQDNSAICVPSMTHKGTIPWTDCYPTGSSESGYIAVHPEDHNTVISGSIGSSPGGGGNMLHYDHKTGQVRIITVWPELNTGLGASEMRHRFQWTYPIVFSRHDSSVLYVTGNLVFKSTDLGSNWEAISPDLTRADPSTLEVSGGPITNDTSGAETYATIFAFAESHHDPKVFWAGSDDGLVHVSRDGGANWENITPPDLGDFTLVSMLEASHHDPATAYMAATRYRLDETQPMLYKTNDYGKTWSDISAGIPEGDYTRCIREDPARAGQLYVGTETGAYVSFDDGASWQSMSANLPKVPVHDLIVKEDDLVAATNGRSFWVMDDLTQLRQITDEVSGSAAKLMKPRTTYRLATPFRFREGTTGKSYQLALGGAVCYYETKDEYGQKVRKFLDAGENPPEGVLVTYYFAEEPEDEVTLSLLDSTGELIKSFSSKAAEKDDSKDSDEKKPVRVPAKAGMNRFLWDMRYPEASKVPDDKTVSDGLAGPLAPPGRYKVTLSVAGQTETQAFDLIKDPRVAATQEDFDAQFELLVKIRDKLSETHDSVNKLRSVRQQVEEWAKRAEGHPSEQAITEGATSLKEKLTTIEEDLIQTNYKGARDRLNQPVKLNAKLSGLTDVVSSADYAPPTQTQEVLVYFSELIDPYIQRLEEVIDKDVSEFDNLVHELEVPAIVPRTS